MSLLPATLIGVAGSEGLISLTSAIFWGAGAGSGSGNSDAGSQGQGPYFLAQ